MAPAAVAAPSRGPSKLQKPTKVRYWKGKPTGAELDDQSDEDSDDADEGDQLAHQRGKQRALQAPVVKADADVVAGGAGRIFRPGAAAAVKVELAGVQVGKAIPVKKGASSTSVIFRRCMADIAEEVESSEEETDDEEEEEEAKPALNVPKAPGSEVRSLCPEPTNIFSRASTRQTARMNPRRRRSLLSVRCLSRRIRGE